MDKPVKRVEFNWRNSNDSGEEYYMYTTDKTYMYRGEEREYMDGNRVAAMNYHEPQGAGDMHYVDVFRLSGAHERIFNLNKVVFA